MTNYARLLRKYDKNYAPGEVRSPEYDQQLKQESTLKHRMLIVDQLTLEAKYLVLTHYQKENVKYLVKIFNNNFKSLHRRASDETIILAFVFFLKKLETPKIRLQNYSITQKYNLTDAVFELILCRITDYFMKRSPITINPTLLDNHDDLIKTGNY